MSEEVGMGKKQELVLLPFRMTFGIVCFVLVFGCSLARSQVATDVSTCDALAVRWDENQNLGSRLDRAKGLETQGQFCIGKGFYDVRLAILYLDAGDLSNADRIAKQGIARGSQYQPNLRQVSAETTLQRGDVDMAYKMAEEIAKSSPAYVPILSFLFGIDAKRENWEAAFSRAKKWNAIDHSALSLLALATVLHQLDRHEECVKAVYDALKLEPVRIAKTTGVLEAIFSLGILQRNQEAAELLKRHMNANPNWARNPSMVNAAKALGMVRGGV